MMQYSCSDLQKASEIGVCSFLKSQERGDVSVVRPYHDRDPLVLCKFPFIIKIGVATQLPLKASPQMAIISLVLKLSLCFLTSSVTDNHPIVDILDVKTDDLFTYFIQDALLVLRRKNPCETLGFRRSSIDKNLECYWWKRYLKAKLTVC